MTALLTADPVSKILAIQDNYSFHIRAFTRWLAAKGLAFSEEAIGEYFADLNESDYSASTIRIKRAAVKKRLLQLAQGSDHRTYERLQTVLKRLDEDFDTAAPKVQRAGVSQSKVLDVSEYRRLVKAATPRQACFIAFLWSTGCRVSEMTGIKHGHVLEKGEKVVRLRVMGKGRKEREVRITRALYDTILDTFRGELYLFETAGCKPYRRTYITAQLDHLGQWTIGRRVHAHMFRHSFASRKVQALPGKIEAVSKYLGHASVSTTLNMYVHSALSDSELLDTELAV